MRQSRIPVLVLSAVLVCALVAVIAPASAAEAPGVLWQRCLGGSSYEEANDVVTTADGGSVCVGYAQSTDGDVAGLHGAQDAWIARLDSSGALAWQRCLGGTSYDQAMAVETTADGGLIVVGWTDSNDGDVSGNHGGRDVWVLRLDSSGTLLWQRCLGGSLREDGYAVMATTDAGFIVAGQTYSTNGDVSGNHGGGDAWIVKLSGDGTVEWQRCLGGSADDSFRAVDQGAEGGFVLTGNTMSTNGDVVWNHGGADAWVVTVNHTGAIVWQRCLGGTGSEFGRSVHPTADGGYIVSAAAYSNDGDVAGNHGLFDAWLVKLTGAGAVSWQRCLGGSGQDWASEAEQTPDGGYIMAGYAGGGDGDVSGYHGVDDLWIVKVDPSGGFAWQRCMGGEFADRASAVEQTADGGFLLAGSAASSDGDVLGHHGASPATDLWVVRLGAEPHGILWQRCYGGTSMDEAYAMEQTADGGYVMAGSTYSDDGDVSGYHGSYMNADVWVTKVDADGKLTWQRCLGGTGFELSEAIRQTADGGYIVAAHTFSTNGDVSGLHGGYDLWVIKLDAGGTLQWQRCIGDTGSDYASEIQLTADGGYVVAGYTDSTAIPGYHGGNYDAWVVRLDASGALVWQRCLGGKAEEWANAVQELPDGAVVVAGYTISDDLDFAGNHGYYDAWVAKLDRFGEPVWIRCLGGKETDAATSLVLADEGFLVAGYTESTDGDVSGNHGHEDAWLVQLDSAGAITGQRCLGGSESDVAKALSRTSDGGFVVAGYTNSNDGDVRGFHGGDADYWVVKVNGDLATGWQRCLGGSLREEAWAVQQTADGAYAVAGFSYSTDGEVTGNHGSSDFWLVRLRGEAVAPVLVIPGGTGFPRDLKADGLYEDVNGNGRKDFADVVLYFNQMSWIAANEPVSLFDYNGNGRIDFADVVWLFNNL